MKSVLLVLGVLIFAGSAGGQTESSDRQVQGTADSIVQEGNILHLRGHVELRRGPTVVTADEADLPARVELDQERPSIELRGNVRMRIEDPDVPLSLAPNK
jgi:lipopolysaccharide export system protein LptA